MSLLESFVQKEWQSTYLVDIDADDFEGKDFRIAMPLASVTWCQGFHAALDRWPDFWKDTFARPDLQIYFDVIRRWAEIEQPGNFEKIQADAEAQEPLAFGRAALALARALRKL